MSYSDEDIVQAIKGYQERLDRYVLNKNTDKIIYVLNRLSKLPVRTVHLEETGVGRTVNGLKKLGDNIGEIAKDLVSMWKLMVVQEEEAAAQLTPHEEEDDDDNVDSAVESADSSFTDDEHNLNNDGLTEFHNSEENKSSRRLSKTNIDSKRDNGVSESYRKKEEEEKKNDKREKDRRVEGHSSKRKRDSSSESEKDERAPPRPRERSQSRSKRKRDTSVSSEEEDDKRKPARSSDNHQKKHKSKSDRAEKDSSSKIKSKDKTQKEDKHKSEERSNEQSNKKSEHKKDHHHSKHESSKSNKDEKHSSKYRSHSEKHDTKDKSRKEESGDKSHSSKKDKDRDGKEKKKDRETRDKEKEQSKSKPEHESTRSKERKHKEKKDKAVEKKGKSKMMNGIGSESGASFAEALGMCEPLRTSKASSKKKSLPSTSVSSEKEKSFSWLNSSKPDSDDVHEPYVPEVLKEPNLEPVNLNLSSLLPEISPNYRPVGFAIEYPPKKVITEDEALSRVMANKNLRTKVYSGNKTVGKVESLFELCVRILQDNIDALEYTGGVPFSILKAVLEKATPDQLFNMEHHNPYLIDDTDDLWKLHCQKEFRTKKREELESWRDMYMRCLDEREARLNAITATIKQSQVNSVPVRTAKLAYVDSVAKPPRNIARKQIKNGISNEQSTSAKLVAIATSGEAGKVAVPNPGSKAMDRSSSHHGSSSSSTSTSSANHKPKKAPLMAKTLSFFKNRFKR